MTFRWSQDGTVNLLKLSYRSLEDTRLFFVSFVPGTNWRLLPLPHPCQSRPDFTSSIPGWNWNFLIRFTTCSMRALSFLISFTDRWNNKETIQTKQYIVIKSIQLRISGGKHKERVNDMRHVANWCYLGCLISIYSVAWVAKGVRGFTRRSKQCHAKDNILIENRKKGLQKRPDLYHRLSMVDSGSLLLGLKLICSKSEVPLMIITEDNIYLDSKILFSVPEML